MGRSETDDTSIRPRPDGFCRKLRRRSDDAFVFGRLCGQRGELGKRAQSGRQLTLADHGRDLDTFECCRGSGFRFPYAGPQPPARQFRRVEAGIPFPPEIGCAKGRKCRWIRGHREYRFLTRSSEKSVPCTCGDEPEIGKGAGWCWKRRTTCASPSGTGAGLISARHVLFMFAQTGLSEHMLRVMLRKTDLSNMSMVSWIWRPCGS